MKAHTLLTGDRVSFCTTAGEMLGTIEELREDDIYIVRPDDGNLPRLVLLGRSMRPIADESHIITA